MKTFNELLEDLKGIDEVSLMELLGITSEDLVREYEDRIYDKQKTIERYLGYDEAQEEEIYRGNS